MLGLELDKLPILAEWILSWVLDYLNNEVNITLKSILISLWASPFINFRGHFTLGYPAVAFRDLRTWLANQSQASVVFRSMTAIFLWVVSYVPSTLTSHDFAQVMELENIVANTVYLKARESEYGIGMSGERVAYKRLKACRICGRMILCL